MSDPKICPLLSAAPVELNADCMADRCAWFHSEYRGDGDFTHGECVLLRIADKLAKSQTLTNLKGECEHEEKRTASSWPGR